MTVSSVVMMTSFQLGTSVSKFWCTSNGICGFKTLNPIISLNQSISFRKLTQCIREGNSACPQLSHGVNKLTWSCYVHRFVGVKCWHTVLSYCLGLIVFFFSIFCFNHVLSHSFVFTMCSVNLLFSLCPLLNFCCNCFLSPSFVLIIFS